MGGWLYVVGDGRLWLPGCVGSLSVWGMVVRNRPLSSVCGMWLSVGGSLLSMRGAWSSVGGRCRVCVRCGRLRGVRCCPWVGHGRPLMRIRCPWVQVRRCWPSTWHAGCPACHVSGGAVWLAPLPLLFFISVVAVVVVVVGAVVVVVRVVTDL